MHVYVRVRMFSYKCTSMYMYMYVHVYLCIERSQHTDTYIHTCSPKACTWVQDGRWSQTLVFTYRYVMRILFCFNRSIFVFMSVLYAFIFLRAAHAFYSLFLSEESRGVFLACICFYVCFVCIYFLCMCCACVVFLFISEVSRGVFFACICFYVCFVCTYFCVCAAYVTRHTLYNI